MNYKYVFVIFILLLISTGCTGAPPVCANCSGVGKINVTKTGEPYQVADIKYEPMKFKDNYTVPASGNLQLPFNIRIEGKRDYIVKGSISEISGSDINFYVFDRTNFYSWNRGKFASPILSAAQIKECTYSFTVDRSDNYYFVFVNTWGSDKEVKITGTKFWSENVTKYETVNLIETCPACGGSGRART